MLTVDGWIAINNLKIGDLILAADERDSSIVPASIEQLYSTQVHRVLLLYIGNEVIKCTDEHPFFVSGKGWIKAGEIVPGDGFLTLEGEVVLVDCKEVSLSPVRVYNMTVSSPHTFFVSRTGVLTHNKPP